MNMPFDKDKTIKVTQVEPVFDYSTVSGGFFFVYINNDEAPLKLNFLAFIKHLTERDQALFEYLKKTASLDKTASHVIYDLYEIGFPVDDKVSNYVAEIDSDLIGALAEFYSYIKFFGDQSGSLH